MTVGKHSRYDNGKGKQRIMGHDPIYSTNSSRKTSPGIRALLVAFTALLLVNITAGFSSPAAAETERTTAATDDVVTLSQDGIPNTAYFPETGQHLSGPFLDHWLNNGRFRIYGFPISGEIEENGRTVQYFERARLEHWPEHEGSEWVIQGTLLGQMKALPRMDERPFKPVVRTSSLWNRINNGDVRYFEETNHTLANGFREFWEENGGLHVFGYPLSEEFREDGYIVQYFERARFEWHPENADTEYEVLLGHLGTELAEAKNVDLEPTDKGGAAVTYDPGVFESRWSAALQTSTGGRWAYVGTNALNVRAEPNTDAEIIDVTYSRHPVVITGITTGIEIEGLDAWYRLSSGGYVPATYIDPLIVPEPPQTYGGHWVDVNLSHFYAVAYNGSTPVYVAIITAGRGEKTPKGVFNVQYRVETETMDSTTVGIPEGDPEHYYLEDVKYTQYFYAGGYALHGNYWSGEPNFGRFSSNGCIGLMNPDAEFFWNWLGVGSVVSIHF